MDEFTKGKIEGLLSIKEYIEEKIKSHNGRLDCSEIDYELGSLISFIEEEISTIIDTINFKKSLIEDLRK
jgi:hypothetical protein